LREEEEEGGGGGSSSSSFPWSRKCFYTLLINPQVTMHIKQLLKNSSTK
jgi:hypothetical protein